MGGDVILPTIDAVIRERSATLEMRDETNFRVTQEHDNIVRLQVQEPIENALTIAISQVHSLQVRPAEQRKEHLEKRATQLELHHQTQEQLIEVLRKLEAMQVEPVNANGQIGTLTATIAGCGTAIEGLRRQLAEALETSAERGRIIDEQAATIRGQADRITAKSAEILRLEGEIRAVRGDRDATATEVTRLTDKLALTEAVNTNLNDQLTSADETIRTLRERVSGNDAELAAKDEEIGRLTERLERLRSRQQPPKAKAGSKGSKKGGGATRRPSRARAAG